jgi:hypothetical protein
LKRVSKAALSSSVIAIKPLFHVNNSLYHNRHRMTDSHKSCKIVFFAIPSSTLQGAVFRGTYPCQEPKVEMNRVLITKL